MKRVIIICEGETEREFCQKLLAPYFIHKNIYLQSPLIKRSMGGVVRWGILKKEIENYLRESDVLVTMFIDYYGLYSKYQFPGWEASLAIQNKYDRMDYLERAMKEDINPNVQPRFIPYLQLHEFEGLLFNDINVFYENVPKEEIVGLDELKKTFNDYPDNPELINTNKETAPSKRLTRIIKGYNKILYGHYFAEAIGLDKIRQKSHRFNNWLIQIENL